MFKLFDFSGTSTRALYWATMVLTVIAAWILGFICGTIIATPAAPLGYVLLFVVVVAATLILIANTVKRCRDCGVSPWWAAATFIPYIGAIVAIVVGCLSTKSSNDDDVGKCPVQ